MTRNVYPPDQLFPALESLPSPDRTVRPGPPDHHGEVLEVRLDDLSGTTARNQLYEAVTFLAAGEDMDMLHDAAEELPDNIGPGGKQIADAIKKTLGELAQAMPAMPVAMSLPEIKSGCETRTKIRLIFTAWEKCGVLYAIEEQKRLTEYLEQVVRCITCGKWEALDRTLLPICFGGQPPTGAELEWGRPFGWRVRMTIDPLALTGLTLRVRNRLLSYDPVDEDDTELLHDVLQSAQKLMEEKEPSMLSFADKTRLRARLIRNIEYSVVDEERERGAGAERPVLSFARSLRESQK